MVIPCSQCLVFPICKSNNISQLSINKTIGTIKKAKILKVGRLIHGCPYLRDWYYTFQPKDIRYPLFKKTFSVDLVSWT
jgi:hypothetical protein